MISKSSFWATAGLCETMLASVLYILDLPLVRQGLQHCLSLTTEHPFDLPTRQAAALYYPCYLLSKRDSISGTSLPKSRCQGDSISGTSLPKSRCQVDSISGTSLLKSRCRRDSISGTNPKFILVLLNFVMYFKMYLF